jgi:hypothetical protein
MMVTDALAMGAPAASLTLPSTLPVACACSAVAPTASATAANANVRAARAKALTQLCFMETSSKGVNLLGTASLERGKASPCGHNYNVGRQQALTDSMNRRNVGTVAECKLLLPLEMPERGPVRDDRSPNMKRARTCVKQTPRNPHAGRDTAVTC